MYFDTEAGERVPVEINALLISTDKGEFLQGALRDITMRQVSDRRLDQYRKSIESTTDMVATVDEAFTYLFANSADCELLSGDEDDIVDRSVKGAAAT